MTDVIDQASALVRRLHNFDASKLSRTDEFGSLMGFEEAVQPAEAALQLFRSIPVSIIPLLPDRVAKVLLDTGCQFEQAIEQVIQFDPAKAPDGKVQQVRNQLISAIKTQHQTAWQHLMPVVAFASCRDARLAEIEKLSSERFDQLSHLVKETQSKANQIDGIVSAARQASGKGGFEAQARFFKEQAKEHEQSAKRWLRATVGFSIGVFAFALMSVFGPQFSWFGSAWMKALTPDDWFLTAHLAIGKVIIFGVLTFSVAISARNFLSQKHNAIVNKHRENAL